MVPRAFQLNRPMPFITVLAVLAATVAGAQTTTTFPGSSTTSTTTTTSSMPTSSTTPTTTTTTTTTLPSGGFAYIPNQIDHTVSVVDTGSNTVINTITVGGTPSAAAVNAPGTRVYITSPPTGV